MKKLGIFIISVLFPLVNPLISQTVTFNYTGAMQQYVVPAGCTVICFTVSGAQGMGNAQSSMLGGLGGRVMGSMNVVPGQVLEIWVGQGGIVSNLGGFNGGGNGGVITTNCCPASHGGGGGGASDIRVAPYGLPNRVVVAGGGGGTGGNRVVGCAPGCGGGGGGGYYGGGGGGAYGGSPGFGGTQVGGGAGGASCCGCPLAPQPGAAGVLGVGGAGGNMNGCNNQAGNNPGCAGGAGGAAIGGQGPNCTGGTGCPSTWAGASGGGGSNYAGPAVITPTSLAGVQAGHGQIVIVPNCCTAAQLTVTANPSPVCQGETATLTVTGAGIGGTYTWSPPVVSNATMVTVTPTANTIYTVSGTNSLNCIGTQTFQLNVAPTPTVTPGSNSPVCDGSVLNLTVNAATTYTWSGPNGFSSNLQNPSINPANLPQAGNYTVTVTSPQGCTNSAVTNVQIIPLPVLNISGTNTLCSQNFNGSSNATTLTASGAPSYTWILPAGYTAPSLNNNTVSVSGPIVTAPTVAQVTVTGSSGVCNGLGTYTILVLPNPVLATSNATVCDGKSVEISASGADSYQWSPASSLSSSSGASVIATPPNTMVYSVVGNSLNCFSATHQVTVDVIPNPNVVINPASTTVCLGSSASLMAFGASTYSWSPPNLVDNPFNSTVLATPTHTTLYTVVGALNGCTSIATAVVDVLPLPNLMATLSKSVICSGDAATINANGASNYVWSPAVNISDAGSNFVTINPPTSTTYTLVGNNGICTGSLTVYIEVVPKPILNLTANPTRVCYGSAATIFANGAQNYNWLPNNPQTSTLTSNNVMIVKPEATTNYTVTGVNTGNNITCSMTQEILVEVVQPIQVSVSNSVAICSGESVKLNASGSNTYKWVPEEGLSSSSVPGPVAKPKTTTVYTVYVSDGGFCKSTGTVLVQVNPTPTVYAGEDRVFNLDEPMYLNAKGQGVLTWIFGEEILCKDCPNSQIMPQNSGCYVIQAMNQHGCKATDEVCIEVLKNYNIYIPNVFTPNADGINDEFLVYGTGITKLEMYIFDRWGRTTLLLRLSIKGVERNV